MERGLKERVNLSGEWVVIDVERDYRVCGYHLAHYGTVHLHHGGSVHRTSLTSYEEARRAVRAYRRDHDRFEPREFEEWLKAWRSGSSPR